MPAYKIKILIVSRTPWNEANSFGNTFTNLFKGIEEVEIANICCQGGTMNSQLIEESFQLTDKDVFKSILGRRPGRLIYNNSVDPSNTKPNIPRKAFFYAIREAIWALGRWKSKKLKKFIQDFNPDVLYLPVYRSHYMCEVEKYIIKLTGAPFVVHISDDVYNFSPKSSRLTKMLQRLIRNDIRDIFKKASYGEVFSPVMGEEFEKEFKIRFYIIGKSVNVHKLPPIPSKDNRNCIKFVYTGNYGGERGFQLVLLAKYITKVFPNGKAVLDVYSTTKADDKIHNQLRGYECVHLMDAVSPDRILGIQQHADYLVHVEGFSAEATFESRLSFSTKIIDYLLAARPIVAIGPHEVTSIQILKSNAMAHIATNTTELENVLKQISRGVIDDETKVQNGRNYLLNHRDSDKMKAEMLGRIEELVKE